MGIILSSLIGAGVLTNKQRGNKMNVIEQKTDSSARKTLDQLRPLNARFDHSSKEDVERVIRSVKPATRLCGLCRIVIGLG